eukprot:jgi/Undpi1/169/HiC_scaffold_1.g00166.m1
MGVRPTRSRLNHGSYVVPEVASAGSAWTRQDPVGLGAPTGAASQRLGAGGAPSRIGDNNNDAATKKRPAWVYPLQAFKGLEPDIIGAGGAEEAEGKGLGAAAVPQDDTVDRRVFVGMGKLSSLTDVAAMQWSYTMGQDSLSKEKHEAVANHDDSTHGVKDHDHQAQHPPMNTDADLEANDVDVGTVMLQDAVDKTLQLILYNAYSGGATPSPPIELDGDVNAIIGSMVLEAFSGRAAAKNQSVRHAEHSDGGGAEGSRDDEIKTEAKKYDYEKWSAELQADFEEAANWYTDWDTESGTPVVRRRRKGPKQWLKKTWQSIRRKGW